MNLTTILCLDVFYLTINCLGGCIVMVPCMKGVIEKSRFCNSVRVACYVSLYCVCWLDDRTRQLHVLAISTRGGRRHSFTNEWTKLLSWMKTFYDTIELFYAIFEIGFSFDRHWKYPLLQDMYVVGQKKSLPCMCLF